MTARVGRKEAGDIVFGCLSESDATLAEGLEITGLTAAQWHTGLAYIRDVLAEISVQPITFDAKNHRYALAFTEIEVDTYIARRIATFRIQLQRLYDGSFVPAGMKLETQRTRRYRQMDEDVKHLIRNLELLAEDFPPVPNRAWEQRRKDREAAGLNHQ